MQFHRENCHSVIDACVGVTMTLEFLKFWQIKNLIVLIITTNHHFWMKISDSK